MADYMDDLFKKIKQKKSNSFSLNKQKKETQIEKPNQEEKTQEISTPVKKPIAKPKQEPTETKKEKQETNKGKIEEPAQAAKESQSEPKLKINKREIGTLEREPSPKEQAKEMLQRRDPILDKMNQLKEMRKAEQQIQQEPQEEPIESETEKQMDSKQKKLVKEYGNAKIYQVPGEPLFYYWTPVVRPIGAEKTIISTIKEAATRIISIAPYKIRDQEQRRNVYHDQIIEILRNSPELRIPETRFEFYANAVVREMVGYGLIDSLINDDKLEEIMIIGPKLPVYVFHRDYEMMLTNIEFYSDSEIQDLINRIARQVGRRVDLSSPLLDARLPDGSRVNATIPPSSVQGSTLTIRKFREEPYSITNLINNGTIDAEAAGFLWMCVEGLGARPANILIAGGTGSGKTTTLNVLASFIPETDRIITIEDTAELNLPLKHWIRMEAKPPGLEGKGELTMDILTKNSLRMRPDRIVVGEIRHDEAFTLFTAFNTGHEGSLGTVHANSPEETLVRVTSPPMDVPKMMLSGLNFVIIQHRLHDKKMGTIRRMTEIAEVTGALTGNAKTKTIFKRDAANDKLVKKNKPEFLMLLEERTGKTMQEIEQEIQNRAKFLNKLTEKKVFNMENVSKEMQKYINGN